MRALAEAHVDFRLARDRIEQLLEGARNGRLNASEEEDLRRARLELLMAQALITQWERELRALTPRRPWHS